jgi:S-adenosylmethionine decarboxylase
MTKLGTEWLVDVEGCHSDALRDITLMNSLFQEIIRALNLKPVRETLWHQFPETGGITGVSLLSESHLACHTWPELGAASFNLYCCHLTQARDWCWQKRLQIFLGATTVKVQVVTRGGE